LTAELPYPDTPSRIVAPTRLKLSFLPAGPLAHDLVGSEPNDEFLVPLWSRAESFGVTRLLSGRIVPGETAKKKIARAQIDLAGTRRFIAFVDQAYWSNEWPGTRVRGAAVVVAIGRATPKAMNTILGESESVFWEGFGGWDDLFLFSKGRIHFHCTTHEQMGTAYGDEPMLSRWGRTRPSSGDTLTLVADSVPAETWMLLTGPSP